MKYLFLCFFFFFFNLLDLLLLFIFCLLQLLTISFFKGRRFCSIVCFIFNFWLKQNEYENVKWLKNKLNQIRKNIIKTFKCLKLIRASHNTYGNIKSNYLRKRISYNLLLLLIFIIHFIVDS